MYQFTPVDAPLVLIYLVTFWGLVLWVSKGFNKESKIHFLLGFAAKMGGALAFLGMYLFYFRDEGDTFIYYQGASSIWEAFVADPLTGIHILTRSAGEHTLLSAPYTYDIVYFPDQPEWTFTRIAGLINLFCFNNYLCLSVVLACFTFIGTWMIYRVFTEIYPERRQHFFVAIFLLPSVLIWTSGLLKDSFCLGVIGMVFFLAHRMNSGNGIWWRLPLAVFGLWLVFLIKPYVSLTFAASALLWMFVKFTRNLQYQSIAQFSGLLAFLVLFLVSLSALNLVKSLEEQESFKQSMHKLQGYHMEYDIQAGVDDSKYTLGTVDYSVGGILQAAPKALVTTFLRPFPWESRKVLMLVMSVENLIYLIVILGLLSRSRTWLNGFRFLRNDEVLFCLMFTLSLGLIVGLTSYNFGLLMRLKSPLLPFFGAGLVICYQLVGQWKAAATIPR